MKVLERNVIIGGGELDIVARDGKTLVFVEVKSRTGNDYGTALEAITAAKARKMAKAIRAYCLSRHYNGPARIDLFAIQTAPDGEEILNYEIIRDCIDYEAALRGDKNWKR